MVDCYILDLKSLIDPCNVLEAGEVHIKSSRRNLIDRNGKPTDLVLGDVLVCTVLPLLFPF